MTVRPALRRTCLALLLLNPGAAAPGALARQPAADDPQAFLAELKGNVVRVAAGGAAGFGFIVGIDRRALLVATAEHTVDGGGPPRVCFLGEPDPCGTGTVVYRDDPVPGHGDLDLALVAVPYPDGLAWRPDVMAPAPAAGEPAWFIGRDMEWFIPLEPGSIVARQDTGTVSYRGLPVAAGVSGAPIVTPGGIVAMHAKSEGGDGMAHGVAIGEIRRRVEERVRLPWVLVPPAACSGQDTHRQALAGRSIAVNFDWARPAAGLDAMARLACLGARPLPRPVWDTADWAGRHIRYRSGDLRAARAIQAVLAPLGRLDTNLGQPAADIEIWIR